MKLKHDESGFHHVLLGLIIVVFAVISFVGWRVYKNQSAPSPQNSNSTTNTSTPQAATDEPLPLKNLGFNLDYYDSSTGHAGDFLFNSAIAKILQSDPIYQKMIWADYGIQDNRSPNDPSKRNVQPTFRLPLGTKVLAPVDGEVVNVEQLYSDDWTIWFSSSSKSTWSYETEHVKNPTVKVGDKVTAGQVVAEVSDYDVRNTPGFGVLEIGLFHPVDNKPTHWCPFEHLDDSVKEDTNKKINAFYDAWESYLGDSGIYNQESYPTPGCATLEPTEG